MAVQPPAAEVLSDVPCGKIEPIDAETYGLRCVELSDAALVGRYFATLHQPLSDYTFSQLFAWRNSLRILWTEIEGHLCVFANGTGDLTLLVPPIGEGNSSAALRRCCEIMDDYNASHGVPGRSRIEYASEELLARFDRANLQVTPMGTDYVYDVNRMIDLAGGDLASKRQAKNRFLRNYKSRVEIYDAARHLGGCLKLLDEWKEHQDATHPAESSASIKRQKESLATRLSLEHAAALNLRGMVVYVENDTCGESIRGFTFGEPLGSDQSSIVIEKTDLQVKGLAQFIFSEFCRREWSDRPLVNVGDDWGLETLAWTKMSYRPVQRMQKYAIAKAAKTAIRTSNMRIVPQAEFQKAILVRPARKSDLAAALAIEQSCFDIYSLKKRQLQYLQSRPTSVFLVAEENGQIVGDCIALTRQHKHGVTGRIYSLAVSAEHRGRKIGKQLIERLLDELSHRGVGRAYLEVEQSNTAAIRLYESLGFRTTKTLQDYYGPARHGWRMAAELAVEEVLMKVA